MPSTRGAQSLDTATADSGAGFNLRAAMQILNAAPATYARMPGLSWYNVQAYAPLGSTIWDGVTDATAAVQAASDECELYGGGIVYAPPGAYLLSDQITLGSNVNLIGFGRATRFVGSATFPVTKGMLYVPGRAGAFIGGFGLYGNVASLPLNGIQLLTCTDCRIVNVDVQDAAHEGISLNHGCYDILVQGCQIDRISGANGWGIAGFWDIKRCSLIGNTIRDCGAYGILLDDGTSGQVDNIACLRNVISGNIVETTTTGMWGIAIEGSSENVVTGNVVSCVSTYGIAVDVGNSANVIAPDNNVIADNFVRATNGMRLSGSYNRVQGNIIEGQDAGIICSQSVASPSIGNVITGNTFKGLTTGANKTAVQCTDANFSELQVLDNYIPSAGQFGVLIQAGADVVVSRNRIRNTQKEAIKFIGIIDGLTIRDNDILNAGVAAVDTYSAIHVESTGATTTNVRVVDNVVNDDQGTKTTWSAVQIKGGAASFSATQVARNRSLRATVQDLIMLGGPTVIEADSFITTGSGTSVNPSSSQDHQVIVFTATGSPMNIGTFSHIPIGTRFTIAVVQDATGGRAVTFDAAYRKSWSDTGNTANKVSTITFFKSSASEFIQVGAQSPYV